MGRFVRGFGPVAAEEVERADHFFEELLGGRSRPARGRPRAWGEQTTLATEIETFLRANADGDAIGRAHRLNLAHPLVMYCETHVGDSHKAEFFAELIRRATPVTSPNRPRFHASERFDNTASVQVALQNYVFGAGRGRLTGALARYRPMLDAAAAVPGHRFVILASNDSSVSDSNLRHAAIFNAFITSRRRHNTLHSVNQLDDRTHGHFLIGAFHGGRVNVDSSSRLPTTTQRLLAHFPRLTVVRLYVDEEGEFRDDGTIVAGESDEVFELTSSTSIELLPILRRVNGGRSFFAPVAGQRSVFSRLRNDTRTSQPYDRVFDSILYLNLQERYTVVRGDTLWGIAQRKLGDGRRWREIYAANRAVVGPNPDRIFPGQVLVIPRGGR